jgi:hypothetical protein
MGTPDANFLLIAFLIAQDYSLPFGWRGRKFRGE